MMMHSLTQATMTVKKEVLCDYCLINLAQLVDVGVRNFTIYGRDLKKFLVTMFFVYALCI